MFILKLINRLKYLEYEDLIFPNPSKTISLDLEMDSLETLNDTYSNINYEKKLINDKKFLKKIFNFFDKKFKTKVERVKVAKNFTKLTKNYLLKSILEYKKLIDYFPNHLHFKCILIFLYNELILFTKQTDIIANLTLKESLKTYEKLKMYYSSFDIKNYKLATVNINSLLETYKVEFKEKKIFIKQNFYPFIRTWTKNEFINVQKSIDQIINEDDHNNIILIRCYNLLTKSYKLFQIVPINFKKMLDDFIFDQTFNCRIYSGSFFSDFFLKKDLRDESLIEFLEDMVKKRIDVGPYRPYSFLWQVIGIIRAHVRIYLDEVENECSSDY